MLFIVSYYVNNNDGSSFFSTFTKWYAQIHGREKVSLVYGL